MTLSELSQRLAADLAPYARQSAKPARAVSTAKRMLDIGVAGLAILLLSPLLVLAACLVRMGGPGPVLFRQTRIGRDEKPFTMLKFRTMRVGRPNDDAADRQMIARELRGEALPTQEGGLFRPASDGRITPTGAFLRRFSIDELPQLFNVISGDMSLVGPRPALPWEVDMFTPAQRRRHECTPGITGLWQVSGRNRLSSLQMLELDLRYVAEQSLWLDLKILARTPIAVLFDRNTR